LPLSLADITRDKYERRHYLLFDLLTTLAKLLRRRGSRTVIAENPLLKPQLIIHSRSRQRAPDLTTQDRALPGFRKREINHALPIE
jgi:hypothetical protein